MEPFTAVHVSGFVGLHVGRQGMPLLRKEPGTDVQDVGPQIPQEDPPVGRLPFSGDGLLEVISELRFQR